MIGNIPKHHYGKLGYCYLQGIIIKGKEKWVQELMKMKNDGTRF